MEGDFYTLFQSQRGERLINIPVLSIYGTSLRLSPCGFIKYAMKTYPWLRREKYIFDLAFVATLCVSLYCAFFLSACNCNLSSFTNFQDIWNPAKSFNLGQNLLRHTTKTFLFSLSSWQKWKPSPNECPFLRPPPPGSPYPILESFRKLSRLFSKIDPRESFIILFFTTKRQS